MNVKNISEFVKDIDQTKLLGVEIENDCHRKVKKLKLRKKWILREEKFTEQMQITLETNPDWNKRHGMHRIQPKKRWEIPNQSIAAMNGNHDIEQGHLAEEVKLEISKELDHPVYDGSYYYKKGEKIR